MNEELELALAYWRTMAPQPKAIVYCNAIEARQKGIETKDIVVDHELANAITRGASIARAKGVEVKGTEADQPADAPAKQDDRPKEKGGRKAKGRKP
ncbi:hypothetical protein [Sinorhizobium sp. RAC02]|uniref:hypothetical protein n=1 Tax=Sinorhizobium sp. RAC02 TaxID=1842534 RepID=UPI00083E26F2|nr:hypothetical protein [Sinorhizobium sp. RAC02]AOF91105.1 hypothetical protein BSY16_2279 [Sinorhizobium sp. RAC02]